MKKTAAFLCDRKTNLACEIGQLIPSNDFNIVSWLIILGGAQKWDSIHKLKLPHNESFYQKKKKKIYFSKMPLHCSVFFNKNALICTSANSISLRSHPWNEKGGLRSSSSP